MSRTLIHMELNKYPREFMLVDAAVIMNNKNVFRIGIIYVFFMPRPKMA